VGNLRSRFSSGICATLVAVVITAGLGLVGAAGATDSAAERLALGG
jgi:hypothetical protein